MTMMYITIYSLKTINLKCHKLSFWNESEYNAGTQEVVFHHYVISAFLPRWL